MSAEDRAAASNGIWLCQNHAKIVDSDTKVFTTPLLHEWKRQAEVAAHQRVISGVVAPLPGLTEMDSLHKAALADLDVYRRTYRWPSTSVNLVLEIEGLREPVETSTLADVVAELDDLILIAPPGMGKTTSLFQIAEGLIKRGAAPLFVSLSDWAAEQFDIVAHILRRSAFRNISQDNFGQIATTPGTVLLLDGWNELYGSAKKRARIQIERLKAEHPHVGLIISSRKQAMDLPFDGARVTLSPLSDDQQERISVALRADEGLSFLDRAWRTSGLRELVSIPLYLRALLSLPKGASFPTSKEEVLRVFVRAHEDDPIAMEALHGATLGHQQTYLEGLAVFATQSIATAIKQNDANRCITAVDKALFDDDQM